MLDDLTPEELAMLGHSLRMVPENAVLTGKSATRLCDKGGVGFLYESTHFKSLWSKVAKAIKEREDMAEFRSQPTERA